MKQRRLAAVLMAVFLFLTLLTQGVSAEETENKGKNLRVMFTHDLHSNILPYNVLKEDGSSVSMGGYARIKTLIDKNKTDTSVLLDGGDFSMGTFFNSIYQTQSPDLALMAKMGYDATTIGNHEFDYGAEGLGNALLAASKVEKRPTVLNSNMVFGDDDTSKRIEQAFEKYGSKKTMVIEKNGVKIGLFGMMGKSAQDFTADHEPITFADTKETAKNCVEELKNQGAEVIICLSHGGTTEGNDKSEDIELAKAAPDIDVIISGHTHRILESPIIEGNTAIVSCGWRGEYLGVLDLNLSEDGSVTVSDYALEATENKVEQNKDINTAITTYKNAVQKEYLDPLGLKFDNVAGISDHNFADFNTFQEQYGNYDIGDIITDAYLNEAKKNGVDATISAINTGLIRDSILKGELTESEIFNILSLGKGADGSTGYSMVDFYISGEELKALCEVDVSITPLMPEAQLAFSGLRYNYNTSRLIFDRVVEVETKDSEGNWTGIEKDKLYHVVCSEYMADMAGLITEMSHGVLSIEPKDSDGNKIENNDDAIIKDKSGNEVKDWVALSNYIKSFPKNESGVSAISEEYNTARETKIRLESTPQTLIENPSNFALIVYGIVGGLILVIILVIILLVRRSHKKRGKAGRGKF